MKITDIRRSTIGIVLGTVNSIGGVSVSGGALTGTVPVATSSNTFVWRDALSFGSNTNDVSSVGTMGASASNTRADHVHRGVHSITAAGSNSLYGDVNLQAGANMAITAGGNSITIASTASGSTLTVQDEGVTKGTASTMNFIGGGVTAAVAGSVASITIVGSGSGTLLSSITAASAAIANTETVVVSASIAANTLAVGQSFRIIAAGVGTTGLTPGNDTFRIRIGTTTLTGNIPTSVVAAANASVTAQPFSFEALVTIRTITAAGTVIGECKVEGNNVATGLFTLLQELSATVATVAVDSTATKLLELTFQSGTAGSSCTFHVATIESLTVAGASGGSSGALVLLEQHTASASATLDFTTCISSTYDEYRIEFINVIPATDNVHLLMRMSTDGGSTYDSGANYDYCNYRIGPAGTGFDSSATATSLPVDEGSGTNGIKNTAGLGGLSGSVQLTNPGSSAVVKHVTGQTVCPNAFDSLVVTNIVGGWYDSTTAVNAFRFLMSSGNITSGTIRVYGIAK